MPRIILDLKAEEAVRKVGHPKAGIVVDVLIHVFEFLLPQYRHQCTHGPSVRADQQELLIALSQMCHEATDPFPQFGRTFSTLDTGVIIAVAPFGFDHLIFFDHLRRALFTFVPAPVHFIDLFELFPGETSVNEMLYRLMRSLQPGSQYCFKRHMPVMLKKCQCLTESGLIEFGIHSATLNDAEAIEIRFSVPHNINCLFTHYAVLYDLPLTTGRAT